MRSPTRSPVILVLAFALGPVIGCGGKPTSPHAATIRPESVTVSTRDYPLSGTVKGIREEAGEVVIAHQEIPGFMPAMSMPFTLKDRAVFEDLAVGDEVEGTLRVTYENKVTKDYELQGLAVRKPALGRSPSLSINLSGGEPVVQLRPRVLEAGEPVPDFTMTTADGETLKLSDLRGQIVVLTFVYTRCPLPEFCPRMDRMFADLAAAIEAVPARARQVRLISLSFDPEHDTPEILKAHARTQGARPPVWTFAVANHEELAKIAPALGLTYGPTANEIVHNLSTALINPRGDLAKLWVGTTANSWTNTEMLKYISPLLEAKSP